MATFRLAMLLGKTLGELRMSWKEFKYWQAYLMLEPPGEADNRRAAAIMATITNMSGRSLPDRQKVTADDFLGRHKQQTAQEQIAFLKSMG